MDLLHVLIIFSFLCFSIGSAISTYTNYLQICEHKLIGTNDQLFKYEVFDSGCQVICSILIMPSSSDLFHEYYTRSKEIEYKVPCFGNQVCINGTCVPRTQNLIATSTSTVPTVTTTSKPVSTTPKNRFNVKIHVMNGYIPHHDAFNPGDIKVKVYINDRHIGNTKKYQDSYHPNFDQYFMAENVSGQDLINFEIWDMDPGFDDFEGRIHTTCNQVLMSGINSIAKDYYPGCQTSSSCWLKVTITCS